MDGMREDRLAVRADHSRDAVVIMCADDSVELVLGVTATIDLLLALVAAIERLQQAAAADWVTQALSRLQQQAADDY
jgi:hypothetical protein